MRRLVMNLRDPRPIWSVTDEALREIREAASPTFEVVAIDVPADGRADGGAPSAEAIAAIADAEVYLGYGLPKPLFLAARDGGGQLRWAHSATAGIGGSLYPEMRESDVVLTNSAGIHAEPMADTILAAILYFARGLDFAVSAQHRRHWDNDTFSALDSPVHEVTGSVVGIVGYGGIGRAVAKRARALGMTVLAHRRRPAVEAEADVEVLTGEPGLERVLTGSRYVVVSLPRTRETEGLLGRDRIAKLRNDAVVINVGRGEVLDEEALADALRERRIRGAYLDVLKTEPLPEDSPLWNIPNLLITPHVSATTDRFWRREVDLIIENLRRYEAGEPLLNTVDKRAGY